MITIENTANTEKVFVAIDEGLRKAPLTIFRSIVKVQPLLERELKRSYQEHIPGLSVHPFVWSIDPAANARARRWWFAAIRDGRVQTSGNRYKRTGGIIASFKIGSKINRETMTITASTPSRGYKYVYTARQIPGHKRTGWQRDTIILNKYVSRATKLIAAAAQKGFDPFAGVPR